MVSVPAVSPVYSTEQLLVTVEVADQDAAAEVEVAAEVVEVKSTEPEGSEAVPASVSVTVTAQVEASSIATGVSHSTSVEVVRSDQVTVLSVEVEAVLGLPAASEATPAAIEAMTVPVAGHAGDGHVVGGAAAGDGGGLGAAGGAGDGDVAGGEVGDRLAEDDGEVDRAGDWSGRPGRPPG